MKKGMWRMVVVGFVVSLLCSSVMAEIRYNVIDLGVLGGDRSSYAYSINNSGQIVGSAGDSSGKYYATLFDSTGNGNNLNLNTLIDPLSGWNLNSTNCINDNGWIVGNGYNSQGQYHAFLLTPVPEPATCCLISLGVFALIRRRHS